jgi:putative transcriptional regulator
MIIEFYSSGMNPMIRIKVKYLLDEKAFAEKRQITLLEVAKETGISRSTLNRVANVINYNTNTDTLDRLCKYFKCDLSELCQYIED